jgi:hypothetical protein
MTFDECFDERTERQHRETSCAGVFQSKPDQPISESATLEALVDLGVDERDQAWACAIGGEANHLTVDRQLIAITLRRVSHLDALRHSHTRNIRTQTAGAATVLGALSERKLDQMSLRSSGPRRSESVESYIRQTRAGAALALLALAAAIVSERFAKHLWVRHPLLAGLASSAIVVMLSVAVVNEVLEIRRRRRWRVLAQYVMLELVRDARMV